MSDWRKQVRRAAQNDPKVKELMLRSMPLRAVPCAPYGMRVLWLRERGRLACVCGVTVASTCVRYRSAHWCRGRAGNGGGAQGELDRDADKSIQ